MIPTGFGVGIPHQRAQDDPSWYDTALAQVSPPWWYDWTYSQIDRPDYVPMLWRCDVEGVARALPIIMKNRVRLWLLGNEPERTDQSNTAPEVFAEAVKELNRQTHGTTIALPGILWDRYGYGKAWLSEYIDRGGPIPDAWHVHLYVWTADEWRRTVPEMLAFLKGIADIPVIISECASWHPKTTLSVLEAIKETVRVGDAQAAAYFSAYYDAWPEPSLLTAAGELTELGTQYTKERHEVFLPQVTVAEGV